MTKLFFDTEFTGLHQATTLISIGIVSECGRTFYCELNDYDDSQVDEWVRENVLANLEFREPREGEDEYWSQSRASDNLTGNSLNNYYSLEFRGSMEDLKFELTKWLSTFNQVEMWSDCLAYDWVLFNSIFGTAFEIPENVYYIPFDLSTMLKLAGVDPDINREDFPNSIKEDTAISKHNAMWDAKIIKSCFYEANKILMKTIVGGK